MTKGGEETKTGSTGEGNMTTLQEHPARSDRLILCSLPGRCPVPDPCLPCFLTQGLVPKGWRAVAASTISMGCAKPLVTGCPYWTAVGT